MGCWTSTTVAISWCVWYKNSHKSYLPFSGPEEKEKARSCQQCPACYIITMFIGFLFSQWQKGHLPTAAFQSSSKISCETYWGTDQSSLTPPIKLQEDSAIAILEPSSAIQPLHISDNFSICFLFVHKLLSSVWKIIPWSLPTVIMKLKVTVCFLNMI